MSHEFTFLFTVRPKTSDKIKWTFNAHYFEFGLKTFFETVKRNKHHKVYTKTHETGTGPHAKAIGQHTAFVVNPNGNANKPGRLGQIQTTPQNVGPTRRSQTTLPPTHPGARQLSGQVGGMAGWLADVLNKGEAFGFGRTR